MNTHDYNLSPARVELLETLYIIRGANARVITQFLKKKLVCEKKEEKQIINLLHRLKEAGLVSSKKLEGKYAGSMYYLSPVGFELAKRLLNIKPLQKGSMWLRYQYPFNQRTKGQMRDYSYETYKPPLRQYKHHHLILKSIVSLYENGNNINFTYRLTLDAVKEYEYVVNNRMERFQLKPDAEININNEIYTLEIDRSTESYPQLVQKFKRYKEYLHYSKNKEDKFLITKIIFVIEDTERKFGIARRWNTIMKAFIEAMEIKESYKTWPNIQLILITVCELANVVRNEMEKHNYADLKERFSKYVPIINNSNLTSSELKSYYSLNKFSHIFLTNNEKQLIFFAECRYYNSDFYLSLLKFHCEANSLFDINYQHNPEKIYMLLTNEAKNSWLIDWNGVKVNIDLKHVLNIILQKVKYINDIKNT